MSNTPTPTPTATPPGPAPSPARRSDLTRRVVLGALLSGAAAYAAFGPRGVRDPLAKGRTRITYWEKWTGHEATAMQRMVDAFNRSQDRIYCRYLSMTLIEQKAMLAIAGGNPPDVVGLYNKSLPLFAQSGAIVPLGALAGQHGLGEAAYGEAIWRLCTVADRPREAGSSRELFGLPNTCSTMALYVNRAILRGEGFDPEAPPTTIPELDALAERLTRARGDGGADPGAEGARYERLGFVPSEPGWWPHAWGHWFGGSLYDPLMDRASADSEENVRAYEWVQSYPRKWNVSSLMSFQSGLGSYSSADQAFLSARVAMCLHGPFLVNVIRQFKPDLDFGVAPFPVGAGVEQNARAPIGLVEADVLSIPRGSARVREAMEFIAFTQRRDIAEQLCIEHAKPSPLAECGEEYYAKHPNPHIRVHEAIARSPRGFGYPQTRVWNEYEQIFRRSFERDIWQLGKPARQALTEIQTQAQGAIDLAREKQERRGPSAVGGAA